MRIISGIMCKHPSSERSFDNLLEKQWALWIGGGNELPNTITIRQIFTISIRLNTNLISWLETKAHFFTLIHYILYNTIYEILSIESMIRKRERISFNSNHFVLHMTYEEWRNMVWCNATISYHLSRRGKHELLE